MQEGGKGAVGSVIEAAANVAASAKSGLDKTKAVVQEKVDRMSSKDEVEKDMATLRKEEKLDLAELRKSKAYAQNATAATAPPGAAVTPNFTDGGGFDTFTSHNYKAAALLSANADHGSPVTNLVGSETNSTGTSVVDSSVNPGMPVQMVQPVGDGLVSQNNPTHVVPNYN